MVYKKYEWIILQQKPKDGGDVMNVNSITSLSQSSYLTYKTSQTNSAFASIANIQTDVTNTNSSDSFLNSSQYSYTSSDDLLKEIGRAHV